MTLFDSVEEQEASPEFKAWWFTQLLFIWPNPMFTKGQKADLNQNQLYRSPESEQAETVYSSFEKSWNEQSKGGKKAYVSYAIKAVLGTSFYYTGLARFLNTTVQFVFPVLLNFLLVSLQNPSKFGSSYVPYYFAIALVGSMFLKAITENLYFHQGFRMGRKVNAALTSAVYRKSLRLSPAARQNYSLGEIVNLMQLDSSRIGNEFLPTIHSLWDGLYQIIGYSAQCIYYLGPSALVGIAVMIVIIPAQVFFMKKFMGQRMVMVKDTDKRVKQMNEVLQGIKVVKLYNWEESFMTSIMSARALEMNKLKIIAGIRSVNGAFMMASPAIVATSAFLVFSVSGEPFLASTLFTALAIYGQLRFPLMAYPNILAQMTNARLACRRLEKYLGAPEIVTDAPPADASTLQANNVAVSIRNGQFYWVVPEDAKASNDQKLVDLNMKLEKLKSSQKLLNDKKKLVKGAAVVATDKKNEQAGDKVEVPKSPTDTQIEKLSAEIGKAEKWTPGQPVLSDVNFEVKKGELVAVIGSVGCGKSSLLAAVLGDLYKVAGDSFVDGSIAYVAQNAWIVNASVRENIVFGHYFDQSRYDDVIVTCQLESDFDLLPNGDSTEIGEKGINLSGGQRQRVSIARAAYENADIYIFDDPLSALDAEVGKNIFSDCIKGQLKDKTRILVTNQLQFLSQCDKIFVVQDAKIFESGTFDELMGKGLDFSKLMKSFGDEESVSSPSKKMQNEKEKVKRDAVILAAKEKRSNKAGNVAKEGKASTKEATTKDDAGKLTDTEEREKGAVKVSVYTKWLGAGHQWYLFWLSLFMFLALNISTVAQQLWIVYWTNAVNSQNQYTWGSPAFFELIYAGMAVLLGIASYFRVYFIYLLGVGSSRNIHNNLLRNVLNAPMLFFDTTPIGRILTRFSKDIDSIDLELPDSFGMVVMCIFNIAFAIIMIIYSTPWFALGIPVVSVFYYFTMQYFRNVARALKRLEAVSRSPIFAHFSETLNGLPTIRAYKYSQRFLTQNSVLIDRNMSAAYCQKSADRWLSVRLEILADSIYLLAAILSIVSVQNGSISAALAGMSLSFASGITGTLNWIVRSYADLEQKMNAVERVLHYTENIPQEPSHVSEKPPPQDWPQNGAITFSNVEMRYRPDKPLVLKKLNFSVSGGEKIGIVGRTGSGKSSIMVSLFRLVENCGGKIDIDGIDITQVGLNDLRSKLTIIPQDPFMFSGTVRKNLDPFDKYTDAAIWDALEKVDLKTYISGLNGALSAQVSEYGENFSAGQRQLVCLARALLRGSKIILLDEATSSIDFETDRLIQTAIRRDFANCTILTIAHRLNTIIDSDRILTLGDGEVLEFDTPYNLLQNETGTFYNLVGELGEAAKCTLIEEAKQADLKRIKIAVKGVENNIKEIINSQDNQTIENRAILNNEVQINVGGTVVDI